ncbi:MAG: 16S rRNA (uracil(1498)-N(3))-methyltransferase [Pseudomonadales bacterium]|nr:16S rRNA (uracil(1498)-N(3))-methyltransferase [Pseudomonadales bacterium]
MNLLLLNPDDLKSPVTAEISDHRLKHIQTVLGGKVGDTLKVGLINGLCGQATITTCTKDKINLVLQLDTPPPPALPLTVVMALPRPKMLRRILKNIAEFGIKECHFINSYKVEKSFWQSPVLKPETIEAYLEEGLIQAKDTHLPKVYLHKYFKPFVEDFLPELINGHEAFIAHPYDAVPMPTPSNKKRLIIIGPEGGFTDYEVKLIEKLAIKRISMGPRIYRVENAVTLLSAHLSCI